MVGINLKKAEYRFIYKGDFASGIFSGDGKMWLDNPKNKCGDFEIKGKWQEGKLTKVDKNQAKGTFNTADQQFIEEIIRLSCDECEPQRQNSALLSLIDLIEDKDNDNNSTLLCWISEQTTENPTRFDG